MKTETHLSVQQGAGCLLGVEGSQEKPRGVWVQPLFCFSSSPLPMSGGADAPLGCVQPHLPLTGPSLVLVRVLCVCVWLLVVTTVAKL